MSNVVASAKLGIRFDSSFTSSEIEVYCILLLFGAACARMPKSLLFSAAPVPTAFTSWAKSFCMSSSLIGNLPAASAAFHSCAKLKLPHV